MSFIVANEQSVQDVLDKVFRTRHFLQDQYATIREILEAYLATLVSLPVENRRNTLLHAIQDVLKKIGLAINKAIANWYSSHVDSYYWPGYESIHPVNGNTRVTPTCQTPDGRTIRCGIGGYDQSEFDYVASAEWFDRLLSPTSDALGDHSQFVPGGTHGWMAPNRRVKNHDHDWHSLISLHVGLQQLNQVIETEQAGFIDVWLPPLTLQEQEQQSCEWGELIAQRLNRKHNFDPHDCWPLLVGQQGQPVADPDYLKKALSSIRHSLYSMWLAACFTGDHDWVNANAAWIEQKLSEWSVDDDHTWPKWDGINLHQLTSRIKDGIKLHVGRTSPKYTHWYTLHIEPTLAINVQSKNLGSAMLLTSKELEPALILIISSWLQKVYQSIRYMEGGLELELSGRSKVAAAVGHETKHVASALGNAWMTHLDQLFDVNDKTNQEGLSSPSKIGKLEIDPQFRDEMIVLPLGRAAKAATRMIQLWCMQQNNADIPFEDENLDLPEFARRCWKAAIEGLAVHAIAQRAVKNRQDIINVTQQWGDSVAILEPKLEFAGGINNFDRGDSNKNRVWLARIMINLFTNCLKHSDPTKPTIAQWTKVENKDDYYRLTIDDYCAPRDIPLVSEILNRVDGSRDRVQAVFRMLEIAKSSATSSLEFESSRYGQEGERYNRGRGVLEWYLEQISGRRLPEPKNLPTDHYQVTIELSYQPTVKKVYDI